MLGAIAWWLLAHAAIAGPQPPAGDRLAQAAERQVGVTLAYDPAYVQLRYPGGDVPIDRGVCTDVVIRAMRKLGVDLQRLVHEDMRRHFSAYPRRWGLKRPDSNIDHRRVPNLATFLRRRGKAVTVTQRPADYRPGDIVTWRLPTGQDHIGVVSTQPVRRTARLLAVHNIGAGALCEDVLFAYQVTGHYRWFR